MGGRRRGEEGGGPESCEKSRRADLGELELVGLVVALGRGLRSGAVAGGAATGGRESALDAFPAVCAIVVLLPRQEF